jgi:transposase
MNALVLPTELETTTVTLDEIVYHRRVRVLEHAGQTSVTEACQTFGISRTTYYRWADRARLYGLAALMPKAAGRCGR